MALDCVAAHEASLASRRTSEFIFIGLIFAQKALRVHTFCMQIVGKSLMLVCKIGNEINCNFETSVKG